MSELVDWAKTHSDMCIHAFELDPKSFSNTPCHKLELSCVILLRTIIYAQF